jgi:hypothetical protein
MFGLSEAVCLTSLISDDVDHFELTVGNALSVHTKVCEYVPLGSNSFLCQRDTIRVLNMIFLVSHQIERPSSNNSSSFSMS